MNLEWLATPKCRFCGDRSAQDLADLKAWVTRLHQPKSQRASLAFLRRLKYWVIVRHDDWTTAMFASAFVVRRGHWLAVVTEHNGEHFYSAHDALVWQLTTVPISRWHP